MRGTETMAWFDGVILAIDTETTGFGPHARILEVAVVHFYKGEVIRECSALLHPNGIDWDDLKVKEALMVNKLTFEEIQGKPLFEEVRLELMQEMGEEIWVAHNASFDVQMLLQELQALGEEDFPFKPALILDTMALDYILSPGVYGHKLADTCQRWGVKQDDAHRSVVDARACGDVLAKMIASGKLPAELGQMQALQKEATEAWKCKRRR